jgi:hypothetical protein
MENIYRFYLQSIQNFILMITISWTQEIMKTIMIEKHFNKASDSIMA